MLENETDNIILRIKDSFRDRAKGPVSLKEILASNIPHSVKHYFRAEVESFLREEQTRHRAESHFDLDDPEVQNLQKQIDSFLILNFRYNDFGIRLDDVVHLMSNYLVRPQWTLSNLAFERDRSVPTAEIIKIFRYFRPYEYMGDIVTGYFAGKGIENVTRDEFRSILWKADGEYIRRKSGSGLAAMAAPIYEFFNFCGREANYHLPVKALIKYFEDKCLSMVTPRLEGEVAQERNSIDQRTLGSILEDIEKSSGIFQVDPMAPDEIISPAAQGKGLRGDGSLIPESDKKKLVKKLFSGDEADFEGTLREILAQESWKRASIFIDKIFIKSSIDPYSAEAKSFVDLVYRQYHLNG